MSADNLLLRGSSVRNTDSVLGIAVFTGHDTKIMKNSTNAKYKFSRLEVSMNKALGIIFMTQFVLALIGAVIGTNWVDENDGFCSGDQCKDAYYLGL